MDVFVCRMKIDLAAAVESRIVDCKHFELIGFRMNSKHFKIDIKYILKEKDFYVQLQHRHSQSAPSRIYIHFFGIMLPERRRCRVDTKAPGP